MAPTPDRRKGAETRPPTRAQLCSGTPRPGHTITSALPLRRELRHAGPAGTDINREAARRSGDSIYDGRRGAWKSASCGLKFGSRSLRFLSRSENFCQLRSSSSSGPSASGKSPRKCAAPRPAPMLLPLLAINFQRRPMDALPAVPHTSGGRWCGVALAALMTGRIAGCPCSSDRLRRVQSQAARLVRIHSFRLRTRRARKRPSNRTGERRRRGSQDTRTQRRRDKPDNAGYCPTRGSAQEQAFIGWPSDTSHRPQCRATSSHGYQRDSPMSERGGQIWHREACCRIRGDHSLGLPHLLAEQSSSIGLRRSPACGEADLRKTTKMCRLRWHRKTFDRDLPLLEPRRALERSGAPRQQCAPGGGEGRRLPITHTSARTQRPGGRLRPSCCGDASAALQRHRRRANARSERTSPARVRSPARHHATATPSAPGGKERPCAMPARRHARQHQPDDRFGGGGGVCPSTPDLGTSAALVVSLFSSTRGGTYSSDLCSTIHDIVCRKERNRWELPADYVESRAFADHPSTSPGHRHNSPWQSSLYRGRRKHLVLSNLLPCHVRELGCTHCLHRVVPATAGGAAEACAPPAAAAGVGPSIPFHRHPTPTTTPINRSGKRHPTDPKRDPLRPKRHGPPADGSDPTCHAPQLLKAMRGRDAHTPPPQRSGANSPGACARPLSTCAAAVRSKRRFTAAVSDQPPPQRHEATTSSLGPLSPERERGQARSFRSGSQWTTRQHASHRPWAR